MRCGIDGEDTDLQVDDCEAVSFLVCEVRVSVSVKI